MKNFVICFCVSVLFSFCAAIGVEKTENQKAMAKDGHISGEIVTKGVALSVEYPQVVKLGDKFNVNCTVTNKSDHTVDLPGGGAKNDWYIIVKIVDSSNTVIAVREGFAAAGDGATILKPGEQQRETAILNTIVIKEAPKIYYLVIIRGLSTDIRPENQYDELMLMLPLHISL